MKRNRGKRKVNAGIALLALACAVALAGLGILTAVCLNAGRHWTAGPADCIVVLGAHVQMDGRMSQSLLGRCEAALAAWREGLAPVILVTGGQGRDEPGPQAAYMAEWLKARGVPGDAILTDPDAMDTTQNVVNARRIMEAHGLSTAAICTNDYHLRRALWLARDHGLRATGGIAAPSPSSVKGLLRSRVRETCSWVLYFLGVP